MKLMEKTKFLIEALKFSHKWDKAMGTAVLFLYCRYPFNLHIDCLMGLITWLFCWARQLVQSLPFFLVCTCRCYQRQQQWACQWLLELLLEESCSVWRRWVELMMCFPLFSIICLQILCICIPVSEQHLQCRLFYYSTNTWSELVFNCFPLPV